MCKPADTSISPQPPAPAGLGRRGALTAALLVVAGCSSAPKPPPVLLPVPRVLDITVQADAQLNTDARNRAAPLVMRLYILKAPAAFAGADFFTLYEKDQSALANDLVTKEEIQMRPGETRRIVRDLKPEARVVGVIGAFRELERANWRAQLVLPEPPPPVERPPTKAESVPLRVGLGAREVRLSSP